LNAVLMPEAAMSPVCSQQAVTMAGDVLTDIPMIQQLLHMLSFGGQRSITFEDFSTLLFSPWLKGYECERMLRAELDATFRRQNRHRLSFRGLLQSSYVQALPQLLAVIKALAESKPGRQSARQWVDSVHELLKASGFVPSGKKDEIRRSNMEIRQMNAFRDVLVSLVAADAVCGKLGWSQFLSMLRSACAENRLALAAKFPNVMVMPLARLSGMKFDHVLVSGLNEEAFPPPAIANPMLPAVLQQKKRIPMSSGALAFECSEQLWQQLLQAAPTIEISYAKQKDEKDLLPSPFAANLNERIATKSILSVQRLELESFEDALDVPLVSDETVHGGTAIIKNQSACPFRAFATHRLNISGLEETSPGIEAGSKGSLIHLALEYIWKQLQTQAALAALGDDEMMPLIDAAICHAWQQSHVVADVRTRDYEQKRMRRVLSEWLGKEKERPDFRVVGIEQKYQLQLPESSSPRFAVNIKADRMDEDESGRRILIDYKTGAKQSLSKWLNERIEEPQLPLYALATGLGENDAVAFARVRSGDMAYEGLCGENIGIKGIVACDGKYKTPEDWQQVLDDWKANINALATEFVQGRCEVSPSDANACKYCGLEAVCRIKETGFDTEAEEV
jgi:probable DNA repair protein